MQTFFTLLLAILGFSVLILVHEAGHCIAAKLCGVQVNEFWLGMGPSLVSKRIGETVYCLKLFPIGGACVMEGEDLLETRVYPFAALVPAGKTLETLCHSGGGRCHEFPDRIFDHAGAVLCQQS